MNNKYTKNSTKKPYNKRKVMSDYRFIPTKESSKIQEYHDTLGHNQYRSNSRHRILSRALNNGNAALVADVIISFLWNKDQGDFTLAFLADEVGLTPRQVRTALKLIDEKLDCLERLQARVDNRTAYEVKAKEYIAMYEKYKKGEWSVVKSLES